MAFHEVRFPDDISRGARGGPHARQAPAPDPQLMRDRMKLATRGGPSKS